MVQIFVSFSNDDHFYANGVTDFLRSKGIAAWNFQDDTFVSSNYADDLHNAIKDSEYFLVIHSSKWTDSPECRRERDVALSLKKSIIILHIPDSNSSFVKNDILKQASHFHLHGQPGQNTVIHLFDGNRNSIYIEPTFCKSIDKIADRQRAINDNFIESIKKQHDAKILEEATKFEKMKSSYKKITMRLGTSIIILIILSSICIASTLFIYNKMKISDTASKKNQIAIDNLKSLLNEKINDQVTPNMAKQYARFNGCWDSNLKSVSGQYRFVILQQGEDPKNKVFKEYVGSGLTPGFSAQVGDDGFLSVGNSHYFAVGTHLIMIRNGKVGIVYEKSAGPGCP